MQKWSIPVLIAIVALLMPLSTASVSAQGELGISKSADKTSASLGDNITYTYTITNNADNVTISNISLVDDKLGSIDLGGQTSLDAGATITATATHTVAQADLPGPLVNTATISGTDPDGNPVTASATASVDLTYTASLQLTKTAEPTSAAVGNIITYTYTITNGGNVTINDITLEDVPLGSISLSDTTLAPGNSTTATATYTVAQADLPGPIENTATVSGTDLNGNPITDEVSLSVPLTSSASASLQLTKTADKTSASFGDNITYTYTITNTGNATVSNVTLVDDKLGKISLGGSDNITLACCQRNHSLPWQKYHLYLHHHQDGGGSDNITLAPGDTVTATATHTVSFSDLLRGSTIVNKATVKGTDPTCKRVTASATATVSINKTFPWKRDILKHSGVHGKGIDKAPGLQKPFNPKSKAAEHAGQKGRAQNPGTAADKGEGREPVIR